MGRAAISSEHAQEVCGSPTIEIARVVEHRGGRDRDRWPAIVAWLGIVQPCLDHTELLDATSRRVSERALKGGPHLFDRGIFTLPYHPDVMEQRMMWLRVLR